MEFFTSVVTTLQTLVVALGEGLAVWGGNKLIGITWKRQPLRESSVSIGKHTK